MNKVWDYAATDSDQVLVKHRAAVEEISGKYLECEPIHCDARVEVENRIRRIFDRRTPPRIARFRAWGTLHVHAPFAPDITEVRAHVRVPGVLEHPVIITAE